MDGGELGKGELAGDACGVCRAFALWHEDNEEGGVESALLHLGVVHAERLAPSRIGERCRVVKWDVHVGVDGDDVRVDLAGALDEGGCARGRPGLGGTRGGHGADKSSVDA